MAIAYDNTTATESTSFSYTCTGSDLSLVAIFLLFSQASNGITASPTYDGVSMTQIDTQENNYSFNRYQNAEIWRLDNPSTGSNTFSWSATGTLVHGVCILVSFTGANNGSYIASGNKATGDSSTPSATWTTSTSDGMIVGGAMVVGGDTDPFSPGADVTEVADGATGTNANTDFGYTAGYKGASGGSDTLDFTASVSDDWTIVSLELLAAASGVTLSPLMNRNRPYKPIAAASMGGLMQ